MRMSERWRQLRLAAGVPAPDEAAAAARLGAVVATIVPPESLPGVLLALGRVSSGRTQAELAAATGIARSVLAEMERGSRRVTAERAAVLGDLLGIPADLLEAS